jgi:DNA-binding CsgD family transcriptional regulator
MKLSSLRPSRELGLTLLGMATERYEFTPREREVVWCLMEGLTSKQIATQMGISINTVKAFLRIVMVRMEVTTRSAIVGKLVNGHEYPRPVGTASGRTGWFKAAPRERLEEAVMPPTESGGLLKVQVLAGQKGSKIVRSSPP